MDNSKMTMRRQLMIPVAEAEKVTHIDHGQPWTTSLLVAQKFEKRHDTVLRAIRNLECSDDFRHRNFAEMSVDDSYGRKQPAYRISRDGFSFLAMGFTGKEAARWKEQFIHAFNQMDRELTRLSIQKQNAEWQEVRSNSRAVRMALADTVHAFVEYATTQGSKNARMYYMNLTKMEHRALFMVEIALGTNLRDRLTASQLGSLITAENIVQRAMREGMADNLNYKSIYTLAKQRVESFATMIGKTLPGDDRPMLMAK